MELHQLRAFLAVRDTGSATAAATRLGVQQSTVSAAVRALEKELGAELFHRVGRGMIASPAGHALVGPARRIVRDCAQAGEHLRTVGGLGRLELAALSTMVTGPFTELVARWLGEGDGRTMRVHDLPREEDAADMLTSGTAEVVCTRLPLRVPVEDGLEVVPIGTWEWQVAYPPGAPTDREPVTVAELAETPMVLITPGMRSSLERATQRTPLRAAVVADQREARTALMLAGVGPTIVGPTHAAEARLGGCVVRALTPSFTQSVGMLYDPGTLSPVARSFVESLRDADEGGAGG